MADGIAFRHDSLPYRGHRFPTLIIQHAIWLYLRLTLSYRDVEELLAERGLALSYETIRRWVLKFGPLFARRLRQRRPRPGDRWYLDEMVVRIAGKRMYLWRAVDQEGEILFGKQFINLSAQFSVTGSAPDLDLALSVPVRF